LSATWVTLSGSLPPGAAADGYAQLVRAENLALDTTQPGTASPALIKVNAVEAAELTGRAVTTEAHALAAARGLRERIGGDGKGAM
jgi:fructose-1-phosphate kinase PfkB-like protein